MLTTNEAAEILGVSISRVRQLLLDGELKGEHHGRDWLIDERVVRKFGRIPRPRGCPVGWKPPAP